MNSYFYKLVCLQVILSLVAPKIYAQQADLPTRWTTKVKSGGVPLSEYPRPQFRRNEWLCLNGWWDYIGGKDKPDTKEPAMPVAFQANNEQILVPFCPESVLSGIKRKQEINLWYRRNFVIPDSWHGRSLLLHFDAVDQRATVFVNGHKAGTHEGGYDGFTIDITDLAHSGKNQLIVAVKDENNGETPSGKNGPRGDYTFTSGIWQTVWIEPVEKTYVKSIKLLPDVQHRILHITIDADSGTTIIAAAYASDKRIASVISRKRMFDLPVPNGFLWTPERPFLYDLKIILKDRSGRITDKVMSYFGMRDMRLGKVNGTLRPLLNGEFVMQLGLLDQGYWPDGILTAPTEEALKSDILFTKRAGFNVIRKHMKTEPQRFYYWADKLGLMVWQDMPAIWYPDKDTSVNRSRFRKELKALIDEHYNSPCIVSWVPFNENWGAFDVREITDWTKSYDASRLVNGNSGFNNNPTYQKAYGDPGNGDFVDTHLYSRPYKPSVPDDKRAASLGEFGGIGLFVDGHMWPIENNAYDYAATKTALTDQYVLLLSQIDQFMKYRGLSTAIYTQTTDVEHEVNGMLTYDRSVEKMDMDRVRQINMQVIRNSRRLNKK